MSDEKKKVIHRWELKHRPPEKKHGFEKKVSVARAFSFSMEPQLYRKFMLDCKERQVNASALIRRLIYLQMRDWALGKNDVEFLAHTQQKELEEIQREIDLEDE